jgi:hypothetical protein
MEMVCLQIGPSIAFWEGSRRIALTWAASRIASTIGASRIALTFRTHLALPVCQPTASCIWRPATWNRITPAPVCLSLKIAQ